MPDYGESDGRYDDAWVAGWEDRNGVHHEVYDEDGRPTGEDSPSDLDLELAQHVTIHYENEHGEDIWITVEALTADYDIDDAIAETWEQYA